MKERDRSGYVYVAGLYCIKEGEMFRKAMIALCAAASVMALTPNMALARGGGGGGGGHGGGGGGFGGGHAGGFGGGGFGGAHAGGFGGGGFGGARAASFGGANFAARGTTSGNFNSFARAPAGNVGAVQGNRFASGNFGRFGHNGFHHGFHRGRFFVGGVWGPGYDYWDYPDYAYDDSYYDDGSCYVVQRRVHTSYGWRIRPVQVCG
jgi:hypothetical protein